MKLKLKNIASIQTGLFAKPVGVGEVVYLQAKHFDENGILLTTLHRDLKEEEISPNHLLKEGDVLFAAKGSKNFATVYEDHNPKAVASTSFFVIRFQGDTTLPKYIAWYLNQSNTIALLKSQAIGTSIPSISKQVLENIEIPLPEIEIQKTILKLDSLKRKEIALIKQITQLNDTLYQSTILKFLHRL
jgi:restriction endonuclease S subunit